MKAPAANFEMAGTPELWAELDRLRAENANLIARLEQAETDRLTWYEIARTLSKTPPDPPLWVRAGSLKGTDQ
jgi:hypothetical protein